MLPPSAAVCQDSVVTVGRVEFWAPASQHEVMSLVAPLLTVLVTLLAVLPSGIAMSCYQCSDIPNMNTDAKNSNASVSGEIQNSLDKQGDLPSCTEFRPDEARFRAENCPLANGCMKRVLNGKTARSCTERAQDSCKENEAGAECFCSTEYCNAGGRGALVPPLPLLLPVAVLALLNSRL